MAFGGWQSNVLDVKSGTMAGRFLPTLGCNARAVFSPDGTLVATSDPRLYRTSDWSAVWSASDASADPFAPVAPTEFTNEFYDDIQFRPNAQELLVSRSGDEGSEHALYSLADGTLIRHLPELQSMRAKISPEGNWVVSGTTILHLPDGEQRVFDAQSVLATFAPNGDIVALLADNSLARYCRTN